MNRTQKIALLTKAFNGETAPLRQSKRNWHTYPPTDAELRAMPDEQIRTCYFSGVKMQPDAMTTQQLRMLIEAAKAK